MFLGCFCHRTALIGTVAYLLCCSLNGSINAYTKSLLPTLAAMQLTVTCLVYICLVTPLHIYTSSDSPQYIMGCYIDSLHSVTSFGSSGIQVFFVIAGYSVAGTKSSSFPCFLEFLDGIAQGRCSAIQIN